MQKAKNLLVLSEHRVLSSLELSQIWNNHAGALLLIARGHCRSCNGAAEDCVQEAFIRLAKQQPPPDVPVAWLMKAVRNAAIDTHRSQKRRTQREQVVARERSDWLEPFDPTILDTPSTDQIQAALSRLDDITRDIVVAHLWNDMTFRQIASVFDVSRATAHRKYEIGIEQMRSAMTADTIETNSTRHMP